MQLNKHKTYWLVRYLNSLCALKENHVDEKAK